MPIKNPNYANINQEEMAASIGLKAKHIPLLVGSFLDESKGILERLQSAIKAKEFAAIKTSAHSIKGSAGNLRFKEVYEMAKEMESAGEKSDASFEYQAYFDAIKKAIRTIKL